MVQNHHELARKAFDRFHPAADVRPDMPFLNPMACEFTGIPAYENWFNWVPQNAVNRLIEADDTVLEFAEITNETLEKWQQRAAEAGITHISANMKFGAYKAVARRIGKGAIGEIAVSDLVEVAPFPESESAIRELETAGIDIITKDGHAIQVKAATRPRDWDKKDADELIWVEMTANGDVMDIHRNWA